MLGQGQADRRMRPPLSIRQAPNTQYRVVGCAVQLHPRLSSRQCIARRAIPSMEQNPFSRVEAFALAVWQW